MNEIFLDRERHLKFDSFALKQYQKTTGLANIAFGLSDDPSMYDIFALLHACLVWEDPGLTLEQLMHIIFWSKLPEVLILMGQHVLTNIHKAIGG